jgi:hypothetical protein
MASKAPVGRPLKFKTVQELEAKIGAYFLECEATGRPLTITGLALALDTNRETLLDYQSKDEFSDTVTRAKLRIHNFAEESLWQPKVAQGVIFNLKNNHGWSDRHEFTGEDGKPLIPPSNLNQKTADELLGLLTAASANRVRGGAKPRKAIVRA